MDKNSEKFVQQLKLQRYSKNSIANYLSCINKFRMYAKNNNIINPKFEDFEQYIYYQLRENQISASTQKQILASITKYFKIVYDKELNLKSLYPQRKSNYLPNYISKQEVKSMLEATSNFKHKIIIATIYSCGLRLSELLNLRITEINSKTMQIKVRNSKNQKDRYVVLSEKLLTMLKEYYLVYKPKTYLIESIDNSRYSDSSVQKVVKNAAKKAKIFSKVTPHTLRHSYATHLLEAGIDIRIIKDLLGHASVKTTEIYTHLSSNIKNKLKSPFDDF